MVLVDKTLVELLEEIVEPKLVFEESISPKSNPNIFWKYSAVKESEVRHPHRGYIDKLMVLISPDYKPNPFNDKNIPLYYDCICEMYINALERGNKNRDELQIVSRVYVGKRGAVMTVEDSGDGFDYKEKIKKMKGGNKEFFQRAGGGLNTFHRMPYQISFEGKGNIVNMQVLFDQ